MNPEKSEFVLGSTNFFFQMKTKLFMLNNHTVKCQAHGFFDQIRYISTYVSKSNLKH